MVASLLLFLTLFLALPVWGAEEPHIVLKDLKVEYETTPMGIDVEQPRFSWRMEALDERRGYRQSAYRLAVTDGQGRLMWDSGRVKDDGSTGVVYGGEKLEAETRYNWCLEVWTQAGETAVEVSWFETGLNVGERGEPWEGARWIGGGDEDLTLYAPYLPVFALDCRLQLEEGSREAGVVYGANDPRLMDADLNLYGLEGRRNEAHIAAESLPERICAGGYHGCPAGRLACFTERAGQPRTLRDASAADPLQPGVYPVLYGRRGNAGGRGEPESFGTGRRLHRLPGAGRCGAVRAGRSGGEVGGSDSEEFQEPGRAAGFAEMGKCGTGEGWRSAAAHGHTEGKRLAHATHGV